jgi:hypothetical protein
MLNALNTAVMVFVVAVVAVDATGIVIVANAVGGSAKRHPPT